MAENSNHRDQSEELSHSNDHGAPTPWISAWHDPVAGMVCPTSSHLTTADLHADGDFRLIMVDMKRRIRVYKGTTIQFEQKLMDLPVATKCFYCEVSTPPSPTLAVASGNQVFVYRHLKPYLKFTLPKLPINPVEQSVWDELLSKDTVDIGAAIKKLCKLRDEGKASTKTLDFLAVECAEPSGNLTTEERMEKLQQYPGPLNSNSCVTCMEVLKLNMDEPTATSMLVVGTEHKMVYILDPQALKVLTSVELDGVPAYMNVIGLYDVEYRITVACRNGTIYSIKNGQLLSTMIELETQAVGLVRLEKNVYVGTMDQQIHCYHFKGKKSWSLQMPAPIITMSALQSRNVNAKALLVSLNSGEVRCYNGKHLANTIYIPNDYATGMVFSQYGREENALVMSLKSGAIMVKMLYRNATLLPPEQRAGPPPEQDIPLNVPKKTKLYVEQTAREREQAVDMHRIFQRDLCKLRLQTARAYVMLLGQGEGPVSNVGSTQLRLTSLVRGMGPEFQVELEIQNTGRRSITDLTVALSTGPIYTCAKAQKYIAMLVPQVASKVKFDLVCVALEKTDTVRAFIISPTSQVPLMVAAVTLPLSEESMVD